VKDALNKYKKKIESGNYCFPSVKAYKHHARNRKFFEESRFYNVVKDTLEYSGSSILTVFFFYFFPAFMLIIGLVEGCFFCAIPTIIMVFFWVAWFIYNKMIDVADKSASEIGLEGLSIENISLKKLTLKEFEELVKNNTSYNFEEIMRMFKKEKRSPLEIDAYWAEAIHVQMIKDVEKQKEKVREKERKVQIQKDLEFLISE